MAPGDRALVGRLLELARRARERPMDKELPDRVLEALGLSVRRRAPAKPRRTRRGALALGLAALLALLLLPPGRSGAARLAQAPLLPTPPAAPVPEARR